MKNVTENTSNSNNVKFDKTTETLVQILERLGVNTRIKNENENKCELFMGRKKYSVSFGENFIRIAKDDKKIQLAYSSKKNTEDIIQKRLLEIK
jgi:hypothetical protein